MSKAQEDLQLPTLSVDFNEMVESSLVLLSKNDRRIDVMGREIKLVEGMKLKIVEEDFDEHGNVDNLVAIGYVELNTTAGWAAHVKWVCRIDSNGIDHESSFRADE